MNRRDDTDERGDADRPRPAEADGRGDSPGYSEEEILAAVRRIGEASSFAEAERAVALAAPDLQRILVEALAQGGWFGEAHDSKVLAAATTPDEDERLRAVDTLLAEETRLGMMVGVAVGWALREELDRGE